MKADCGHELEPPGPSVVQAGGWCAPSGLVYDVADTPTVCSDCKARMLMIMEVGIDPGRNGENLRVRRGGIQYPARS